MTMFDKDKIKAKLDETKARFSKSHLKENLDKVKKQFKKMKFNTSDSIIGVQTSPVAHWIVWATLIFFVVIILWAKFATLEEVTISEATVKPLTNIQSIQNMEGGIIKKIYVKENDIVRPGQLLLELDPIRFSSSFEEANSNYAALSIKISRLTAEIQNKPFVVDQSLRNRFPSLVASEMDLYTLRQQQERDMKRNLELAEKEYKLTKPLVRQGAASEVDVIHLERQVVGLQAQLNEFNAQAVTE